MESVSSDQAPAGGGKNIWKQVVGFVLAIALMYFSFRGCDFAQIWSYARNANLFYIALMCASCIISHIPRAWRWIYLLEPIEKRRVSLWNSFCAIMIGYAVNVAIPRGGEVARLVSISNKEKLPWAGVLPTMLIDRMLDLVVLGLLLGVTMTMLPQQILDQHRDLVIDGTIISVCSVLGLVALPWLDKVISLFISHPLVAKRLPDALSLKLSKLAEQFAVGTQSLTEPRIWPVILFSTAMIWFFYWLNLYIAVWAFGLEKQIDPLSCLKVFALGSMGILIPAPGSVGTYHIAVKTALVAITGLDPNLALAYVSVVHLCCFILVPCLTALICFAIQSANSPPSSTSASNEKA